MSVENSKFSPTPCVFSAPMKRLPLEMGIGALDKKLEWCAGSRRKQFDIFSRLDSWYTNVTDGQTDTGRQSPRLRIASRGRNAFNKHFNKIDRNLADVFGNVNFIPRIAAGVRSLDLRICTPVRRSVNVNNGNLKGSSKRPTYITSWLASAWLRAFRYVHYGKQMDKRAM